MERFVLTARRMRIPASCMALVLLGCSASEPPPGGGCGGECVAPGACGVYLNACDEIVDCGLCRFDTARTTTAPTWSSIESLAVAGSGSAVEVAYDGPIDGLHVARWDGSAWSDEPAVAITAGTLSVVEALAVAPDGTRWLAYHVPDGLHVTHAPAGGAWTDDGILDEDGSAAGIVFTSDGTPLVAILRSWTASSGAGAYLATRGSGGTWSTELVAADADAASIAIVGGAPALALRLDGAPALAERGATGWTITTLDGNANGSVAIAAGADGSLAGVIAFDDEVPVLYRRADGAWTSIAAPDVGGSDPEQLTAAVAADGRVWMLASGWGEAFLTTFTDAVAPVQRIHRDCDAPGALVARADGTIVIVDACTGPLEAHLHQGVVDPGFATACADAAQAVCDEVCVDGCMPDRCAYSYEGGGYDTHVRVRCDLRMRVRLCGEIAQEPAAADACVEALPTTTCDADARGELPPACGDLYR